MLSVFLHDIRLTSSADIVALSNFTWKLDGPQ